MSNNPKQPIVSKKHLARLQREELQRRYLLISAGTILALIVLIIAYGILNETVLKARQPVAVVNGENITTSDFQARVRYERQQIISNAMYLIEVFGGSAETGSLIASQIQEAQTRLQPAFIGEQVVNAMVNEALIRQEAKKRGISVSKEDVDRLLQESLGYFPEGTPTPRPTLEVLPTSTLSPLQQTLVPPTPIPTEPPQATAVITPTATPTATATATLVPSITPTSAPTSTPTPFTQEGYAGLLKQRLDDLALIQFKEADLRKLAEIVLLSQKVQEAVLAELNVQAVEEQVWARHILVPDEATAKLVQDRLAAGEDWSELASVFSTDESNKNRGGDLGWFGRGTMVAEFEQVAFELAAGETSQPVTTSFGVHIIQVLGHEERPLNQSQYDEKRQTAFQEWLDQTKEQSTVDIREIWRERVPDEPATPAEIALFLQSVENAQNQTLPAVVPTP